MVSYKTAQQVDEATIAESRKGCVQRISVDIVKAEIVDGDFGFAGCLRVIRFKCEGMGLASSIEEPRAKLARSRSGSDT